MAASGCHLLQGEDEATMISAPINRRPEDVRIVTIIVVELGLRYVEAQVLPADLVEGSDAARQQRIRRCCGQRSRADSQP